MADQPYWACSVLIHHLTLLAKTIQAVSVQNRAAECLTPVRDQGEVEGVVLCWVLLCYHYRKSLFTLPPFNFYLKCAANKTSKSVSTYDGRIWTNTFPHWHILLYNEKHFHIFYGIYGIMECIEEIKPLKHCVGGERVN